MRSLPEEKQVISHLDGVTGRRQGWRWVAVVPQTDGVSESESGLARSKHHRGTTMEHYAGVDVSLEQSSVCVVDADGQIVREAKVASEPEALISWFGSLGLQLTRVGLQAGALSPRPFAALR